ncbi:MAG: sodium/solute symporter [Sedimentisphaerales bacterium]|nr:sodium/solute symporter [Sedimentisphaerales bacterium]
MISTTLLAAVRVSPIDTAIVWIYLIGIMVVGIAVGYRRHASSEQFFLAGKTLPWPMVGAALFTANISTIHLVGLSASGFGEGIVVGNFEWMAAFCLIVLGLIFVPFYLRTKISTLPEFLERRYNKTCRMILAVVSIWSALLVHIGVSLFAGATVFKYFFGIDPTVAIVIIAGITAVYTILGGLKAVVVTDTIQAAVLLLGCILLTVFGLKAVGNLGIHSWADLRAVTKPDQLSMVHSLRDANGNLNSYSWFTVMIGYHVLGIWYWCTDQTIVQKTLGAKDMRNAELGAIFAGVLKVLPLFIMVFPGVLAYVLFKSEIGDPNDTLVVMVDKLLPPALKGLFAAGLLAAVMSTVEAALNSTATVTADDIVRNIRPDIKDSTLVLIGRITAGVVIVFAMIWSPFCGRFENIFVVINQVPMMFAPAVTTVFVLGVFWKRGTKQAAVTTFAAGILVGFVYFLADLPHDVSAADAMPAIQAKRVGASKIVEQWAAVSRQDITAALDAGIPADKVVKDWQQIPNNVTKAVIAENEWSEEDEPRQMVADHYVALPAHVLRPALEAGAIPEDQIVLTEGAVPENELTAAISAGALPQRWMVSNYGHITHGLGVPFMMMGLILLVMCIAVYTVVSLATPAPTPEELEKMGWRPPLEVLTERKISGLFDPRIVAIGLVVLMVILYVLLR